MIGEEPRKKWEEEFGSEGEGEITALREGGQRKRGRKNKKGRGERKQVVNGARGRGDGRRTTRTEGGNVKEEKGGERGMRVEEGGGRGNAGKREK